MGIRLVAVLALAGVGLFQKVSADADQPFDGGFPVESREQLNAVLWTQTAAEYKANTRTVYRGATQLLDSLRADSGTAALEQMQASPQDLAKLPPAIILDLDETVLDNSAQQAALVSSGIQYDDAKTWRPWVDAHQAIAIAGSIEFLKAAEAAGYTIFYLSNRACMASKDATAAAFEDGDSGVAKTCADLVPTMTNLKALGAPRADVPEAFLLKYGRKDWETKSARRKYLAQSFRIAMLFGDDLKDFVDRPNYKPDQHDSFWGSRWFMLPNPQYGSWLNEGIFADYKDPVCKEKGTGSADCQQQRMQAFYGRLKPFVATAPVKANIRIGTWNGEWLTDVVSDAALRARCLKNRAAGIKHKECEFPTRDNSDYDAMASYFAALSADVVALEEVRNEAAARRIAGPDFDVVMTQRDSDQNVGFAYRRGKIQLERFEPFEALAIGNKGLRFGGDATFLTAKGVRFRAMVVHLKSGCFGPENRLDGPFDAAGKSPCISLGKQLPILESWIDARAAEGVPFFVLGDFNRQLARERDTVTQGYQQGSNQQVWPEIDDGSPANADLHLLNGDIKPVACGGPARADFIDYVISDAAMTKLGVPGSAKHHAYADGLTAKHFLSDHCAVTVDLVF